MKQMTANQKELKVFEGSDGGVVKKSVFGNGSKVGNACKCE